jgi:hypothetical protein
MDTKNMPMPKREVPGQDEPTQWTWNLLVEEIERLRKMEVKVLNDERQWEKDTDREIGLLRDRVKALEDRPQVVPYYPYYPSVQPPYPFTTWIKA